MVVFRRTNDGFVREVSSGLDAAIPLCEVETDLPLRAIYDGVEFTRDAAPDDDA